MIPMRERYAVSILPDLKSPQFLREVLGPTADTDQDKTSISYPIDDGLTLNVVLFDFSAETWDHEK